jgi:hypothetical protein
MTSVFKNAYDHAQKKVQAVKEVSGQIETLLGTGQEEDEAKALELESALDVAQAEAEKAIALYKKLNAGNSGEDVAELFVPVSDEAAKQAGESKTMTRQEFDGKNSSEKAAFMGRGGKVTEEKE